MRSLFYICCDFPPDYIYTDIIGSYILFPARLQKILQRMGCSPIPISFFISWSIKLWWNMWQGVAFES